MAAFTLQWTIQAKDEGKMIREFLHEQKISKRALTDIKFSGGKIEVNGNEVNVRFILKKNDVLTIQFPYEERSPSLKSEDIPLDIIYEDDYLLIVNKPPGMNTIPSREHPFHSLANGVAGYYDKKEIITTIHIVTRLDRNTSGLVVIAKHRHIHHLFSEQQREKKIERIYEAFAEGVFTNRWGTIEEPIRRKKDSIIEREVHKDGQYACTHYKVIKQFPRFTYVELKLETGRTHQIRVHLSYLGHPLLGDDLYGGSLQWIKRQALHCKKVTFFHPISNKLLSFEAPLPSDMEALLR